jgi:hypothetical protein
MGRGYMKRNKRRGHGGCRLLHRKSQSAFELTMITGAMLLVFTVFFIIVAEQSISAKKGQDFQLMQDMAKVIAEEITTASSAQNGYVRTFEVPDTLNGINFTVSLLSDPSSSNHSEVVVMAANYSYDVEAIETLPKNITGQLAKGTNTVMKVNNIVCVNVPSCQ